MLAWGKVRIIGKACILQPAPDLIHEAFTTILIGPPAYLLSNLVPILDLAIVGLRNGSTVSKVWSTRP